MLLGFKSLGVNEENILLALLLYRFAYYFVPVAIALVLSSFEFGNTAKSISKDLNILCLQRCHIILNVISKDILSKIPSFSLAILVF